MADDSHHTAVPTFLNHVYRAGTVWGPSFDLKVEMLRVCSTSSVYVLVTNPELFFPLDQDLSRSRLEHICLWKTDVASLVKKFDCDFKDDGVIHIKLFQGSRNYKNRVKEIQTCLESLQWEKTTVPKCNGGFSLMHSSPLVRAVIVYMKDHYPVTPEELNFHAELKAASKWCFSDDYKQLVLKNAPIGDDRLIIAVTETLPTWEKNEKDLQMIKASKVDKDSDSSDSSDESVDQQLSDVREAIRVLKDYLEEGLRTKRTDEK